MDPNRFEKVLAPLPEGDRKTRIREALLSNIEGEEELKQSVVGAARAEMITLFQRNFALKELDASALAGVVSTTKGKYFSSSFFFLTLFGFWIIHFSSTITRTR
jgi:hypothetical protein